MISRALIPTLIAAGLVIGLAITRLWPTAVAALFALGFAWGLIIAGTDGDFGHFLPATAVAFPNAAIGLVAGAGLRALAGELFGRQ